MLLLGQALLKVFLSASVKLNVYDEPVFETSRYGTSSLEPFKEIHAWSDDTELPAELLYFIVGFEKLKEAFRNITKGNVFDENFLMSVATIGAFAIGEFPEAVAVMLFYQIGELFQSYAVDKSRKSISSLMDLKSDFA